MTLWVALKYGLDMWIPSSGMPQLPGKLFFIKPLAGPLEPEANERGASIPASGVARLPIFRYTAGVSSALLVVVYAAFVTAANVLMKLSAGAGALWPSLLLLAAGNVAGLAGILVYTLLLRTLPLHVAFPLTRGAAVLGVQLASSLIVFHEALRPTEAAGAALVVAGIVLAGLGARRAGAEAGTTA